MKGKNNNNNNQDYISLYEATKFCNYSQEYLSLRARQGKLKSLKLGRNWVTTKEWLQEYSAKVGEYNNYVNNRKIINNNRKIEKAKILPPPENLPVEKFLPQFAFPKVAPTPILFLLVGILIITGGVFGKEVFVETYNDSASIVQQISKKTGTGIVSMAKGIGFPTDLVVSVLDDSVSVIASATGKAMENFGNRLSRIACDVSLATVSYTDGLAALPGVLGQYSSWLTDNYSLANNFVEEKFLAFGNQIYQNLAANNFVGKNIRNLKEGYSAANNLVEKRLVQGYDVLTQSLTRAYRSVAQLFVSREGGIVKKPETVEKEKLKKDTDQLEEGILQDIQERFGEFRQKLQIVQKEKEGVIVLPLEEGKEEEAEEEIQKLKESFSDEVAIERKDEVSGIIKPVFREPTEQEYLYMMVPVKD